MKKKKEVIVPERRPVELDPAVERILNQDEEFDFNNDFDDFELPFESAMEP